MAYYATVARAMGVPDMWIEDCAQEQALAVWQAGDPEVGWKLIARLTAIDSVRNLVGDRRHPAGVDRSREHSSDETPVSAHPSTQFEDALVAWIDFRSAYAALPPRTRRVVRKRAQGWEWDDIGCALGLSGTRACQIYQEARREMRA